MRSQVQIPTEKRRWVIFSHLSKPWRTELPSTCGGGRDFLHWYDFHHLVLHKKFQPPNHQKNCFISNNILQFEDVLQQSGAREGLCKVVDPKLGDDYPLCSVCKVAQLAKACTHENPQLRPSMRSIVVALMTLSSSTEDWDIGSFYENQGLVHLMSGR
ncbi:chitin elicitor receptor kinase 1-like [Lycium ferocissimum]|uniref:chitin elicitor receptor kinase 1-like n=1 Tax=Lycium ferocissimum TaxID=112874 RepID=UPI002815AE5A|nr:chitin elicitor receptor kinase 1-like [Lycium ferocissimum]